MTEKSYEDSTKDLTRKIFKKTIRTTFYDNREDLKVVCLPGKDALELKIYDELRIPRKNIWGLEKDKEIYSHIKRKNLGINLLNISDMDFFNQTNQKFDIVSLDYTGHMTDKTIDSFKSIGAGRLLNKQSILFTNFQAKREQKKIIDKCYSPIFLKQVHNLLVDKLEEREKIMYGVLNGELEDTKDKMVNFILGPEAKCTCENHKTDTHVEFNWDGTKISFEKKQDFNIDKKKARDIGIPSLITGILCLNSWYANMKNSKLFYDFLDFVPPQDASRLIEIISDSSKDVKEIAEYFKTKTHNPPRHQVSKEEKTKFLDKFCSNRFFSELFDFGCYSMFGWPSENTYLIKLYESDAYFPDKIRLFRYQSNSGTPMDCNIFEFSGCRDKLSSLKEYHERFFEGIDWWFIEKFEKEKLSKIKTSKDFFDLFQTEKEKVISEKNAPVTRKILSEEYKNTYNLVSKVLSESRRLENGEIKRVYLGSSYKPKYDAEETAKMILEGKTEEDIKQKFRISKMELAGMKASITKGHYDSIKRSMGEEKTKNLEKVVSENKAEQNKDISIYLDVMSGLPDKIIMDRYNLETMPLAGYKAAIKRGDRKEIIKETSQKVLNLEKNIVINNTLSRISYDGIYYLKNGWDTPREIFNLYKNNIKVYEIEQLEGKESVLILQNKDNPNKTLKTVEDFCIDNKNFSPAVIILDYEGNGIKDKLQESVRTQKELGYISRVFYYDQKNQSKSMKDILENSYLVR